jgi:hypothetical protein
MVSQVYIGYVDFRYGIVKSSTCVLKSSSAHLKVGIYPLYCPLQEWANLWLTVPLALGSLEAGQPRITTRPKNTGAALDGKRQGRVP